MDKPKITILWQIIKDHDISIFQAEDLFEFSNEIVDGVRLLVHSKHLLILLSDTIDDPAFFKLLSVFKGEVKYLYGEDKDEKTICLLRKFDTDDIYDLQTAIADACCRKELPLLQFLLDNFDQDYFDFNSALKCMSCSRTNDDTSVNMLQLLMEKFGETMISIDIHVVMEVAITRCDKSLVKYLLSKFDKKLFDIQSAMRKSCNYSSDFLLFLIETFDQDQMDMKSAMTMMCIIGDIDLVQSLIDKYDHGLFDWQKALEAACLPTKYDYTCNIKLIKLLLEINKTDRLDKKNIMDIACLNGSMKVVTFLLETFEHKTLNIRSAVNMACRSGSFDKIMVLLNRFDNDLLDIGSAFYQICRCGSLQTVKYFLKNLIQIF
jgi:ankyrin repeat protein